MPEAALHPTVARVVRAGADAGLTIVVRRFPEGTRTAEDAARAIGCHVAQIVKSLVFVADGQPVVALLSGMDRLDPERLGAALGATHVRRADGDEVRRATGYAIGGVPPFGHAGSVPVLIDERLFAHGPSGCRVSLRAQGAGRGSRRTPRRAGRRRRSGLRLRRPDLDERPTVVQRERELPTVTGRRLKQDHGDGPARKETDRAIAGRR
jgi:prolyl-tRNA editing enzyme YbaK/EbsC (Cys-tRNA(Pro) deacylase)